MDKYKKTYEIKSYECDVNGVLRLRVLFNLFQDMADEHADLMGLGYHFCVTKNIGWIGGAYHLTINRLPKWEEQVTLLTWPSEATPVTGIRDFQMLDEQGNILVNATSQWVLVDLERMRPVSIPKFIGPYELISEHAVKSDFKPIMMPEHIDDTRYIPVRTDDIDINKHVNNAVYPTVCLDGLSPDFLNTHQLTEIHINFKKSAKLSDVLCIQTSMHENQSIHQILSENKDVEFARIGMRWK